MTAHNWQPVPEHSAPGRPVDRCTICGAFRLRVQASGITSFARYSPPNANINNTLPWRREMPPCKQTQKSMPHMAPESTCPPHAARIGAAGDPYATQAEVTALAADTWTVIDELEERIAALEKRVADQASTIRNLKRSGKILDRAHRKWRADSQENNFWAYVMESIGEIYAEEAAAAP
jgi:hypothetical protein